MDKEQELLPCPLCHAQLNWDGPLATWVHPLDDCHLSGHFVKIDELAAWNRRSSSDEQTEVVAAYDKGRELGAMALEEIGKMLVDAAAEVRSDKPFASPPPAVATGGVTEAILTKLIAWLRKRGEPDSGITYSGKWSDEVLGSQPAQVRLFGADATFIADHFHGQGARDLAAALTSALAVRDEGMREGEK